jgi:imidazole glycerol-phosphate synthase subunit HisH
MKVAIYDYGLGNLHTLAAALENAGAEIVIETEPERALEANGMVLPGAGAYGPASSRLATYAPAIRASLASGYPCLGIGLGMQLLFELSEENEGVGVAALRGRVRRLVNRRVPHTGWNDVELIADPLFDGLSPFLGYFSHGFGAEPADDAITLAWTRYERDRFPSAVRRDRTWGVQFFPEKSGPAGLKVLENFVKAAAS